jgi:hypothetical protein
MRGDGRCRPVWWLVGIVLLAARVATAAGADPLPSLSLMPDLRLSPPPTPSSPPPDGGSALSPCDEFRLYLSGERPDRCRPAVAAADAPESPAGESPGSPPAPQKAPLNKAWGFAIEGAVIAGALLNTLSETPHQSFHFGNEKWFGPNTYAGGADKASHFVDYYIIAKEMANLYGKLGYTRSESLALGAGLAFLAGFINEAGDGINRYGFSYEDLVMDTSGAIAATVISLLKAEDLVGFRHGILLPFYSISSAPGMVGGGYSSQIYTADLKLAGVGKRLDLNIGPLRYLLVSATYGSKGYGTGNPNLEERQIGFEIGLNVEEILNSLGVHRDTLWGYSLHFVLDNLRLPYTSVGFQYDLNHGKWYGPGNGNSYATQ